MSDLTYGSVQNSQSVQHLMLQTSTIGTTLMAISVVPLLFLLYTLANIENLGISPTHPRVIVEFLFFVGFLIAGFYFWSTG